MLVQYWTPSKFLRYLLIFVVPGKGFERFQEFGWETAKKQKRHEKCCTSTIAFLPCNGVLFQAHEITVEFRVARFRFCLHHQPSAGLHRASSDSALFLVPTD